MSMPVRADNMMREDGRARRRTLARGDSRGLAARIEALPRTPLASLPTPLVRAERLSAALGGPEIWLKRDDLTGFALGGNKARSLEMSMADALCQGANAVVTGGRAHSNHVRMTLAAAARLGIAAVACVARPEAGETPANLQLDHLFGGDVVMVDDPIPQAIDTRMAEEARRLRAAGRQPYVIPRGGASAVGCASYTAAALELDAQLDAIGCTAAVLFCAVGTCANHAGLRIALPYLGRPIDLVGVTVSQPEPVCVQRVQALTDAVQALLQLDTELPAIEILDRYRGDGSGFATAGGTEALELVARLEGILLDPIYTAKAMAGLIDQIRSKRYRQEEIIVFLHTGGWPNLIQPDAEQTCSLG